MSRTKRNWLIASLSTLMLVIAAYYWVFPDEGFNVPEESFSSEEIEKVEVTRNKQNIHLNVYLRKPTSCEKIIEVRDIVTGKQIGRAHV